MKRKDVILEVSLDLFNRHGESNITSVDIANEMDISPGNLYYHFRGKEEIVAALSSRFAASLEAVIKTAIESQPSLVTRWISVYVILEVIYQHRFLLRNIPDIVYNYPGPGRLVVKMVEQLKVYFTSFITGLAHCGEIEIASVQKNLIAKLVNSMMLVVIYWESFQVLNGKLAVEAEYVQEGSLQILSLISPYLSDDQIRELHHCHQQYLREKLVRSPR